MRSTAKCVRVVFGITHSSAGVSCPRTCLFVEGTLLHIRRASLQKSALTDSQECLGDPGSGALRVVQPALEERFVKRVEARDVELDDDSQSMPDTKVDIGLDDKPATMWVAQTHEDDVHPYDSHDNGVLDFPSHTHTYIIGK